MTERFAPEGKLDLAAVNGLVAQLRDHADKDLEVDLTGVSSLGALCLQAFLAAARDARSAGKTFTVNNASGSVTRQLAAMGLTVEALQEGAA